MFYLLNLNAMKIIVLLSASLFSFGFALQNTLGVVERPVNTAEAVVVAEPVEAPVMDVLLDTLEITAEAPVAFSVNAEAPETGVLLDTVEITALAPRAMATADVR
jgi:hypothetical protein